MMNHEALRASPFHLDGEALAWVQTTLRGLSLDERLRQLCNVALHGDDPQEAARLAALRPGGVTRFVGADASAAWDASALMVESANIPLLVSGDIEGGAIALACGTPMPNQLGVAAAGDPTLYSRMVDVMAAEARALGYNWTFTPVLDINAAFRSAIVATRSFGSDRAAIARLARVNIERFQAAGLAATAKHWPGEGFDDRDQHLLTTINPLSLAAWDENFRPLYQGMIDAGVKAVMAGHIAWPAYAQSQGAVGLEACRPASVSALLNVKLLRQTLGFRGLVVSDASGMGGLGAWDSRNVTVPEVIANGCDMLLFPNPMEQDLAHLHQAVADGRLSEARVEEAVTRVLALKASLGLHRSRPGHRMMDKAQALATLRHPTHLAVAREAAAASITLAKDARHTLPLDPKRHRRVVLVTEPQRVGFAHQKPLPLLLPKWLEEAGFEVRAYDPLDPPRPETTDLVLYLLAQESLLLKSHIYLDYLGMHGGQLRSAMQRNWHQIDHVLVSFGHPYYLYDAPRMPCVVNAYSAVEPVQRAAFECLTGQRSFRGSSPVDVSCGLLDAMF